MTSIWRRIQRSNKKGYKFEFTVEYKSIRLVLAEEQEWRPSTLVVVWKRRGRRFRTEALSWPDVEDMTTTMLAWQEQESHTADVMLFKEASAKKFDHKEWVFSLENVTANGQRKVLASSSLNLVDCVEDVLCENEMSVRLVPCTNKVVKVHLDVNITAKFLNERKASDTDSLNSVTDDPAFEEVRESDDEDNAAGPTSRVTVGDRRQGPNQSESKCVMEHRKTVTNSRQQVKSMLGRNSSSEEDEDDDYFTTPLSELPAMEIPGEEELLDWARRVTEGYPAVQITNLTTSWRSGMAFCAILDRFRPGLIDYPGLSMLDMTENNKKAFKAAENIGVPRLLDPIELVECDTPDKLSIMTYLFQLKIHLGDSVDGLTTTVSRYAQTHADAALVGMVGRGGTDSDPAVSSIENSDAEDSDSTSSEEYSEGSGSDDDIVTVPKNWKVSGPAKTEDVGDGSGDAAAVSSDKETPADEENTETQPVNTEGTLAAQPLKTLKQSSMYVNIDDSASDDSPPLTKRSPPGARSTASQKVVDSEEELEVFTASGRLVNKEDPVVNTSQSSPKLAGGGTKNSNGTGSSPLVTPSRVRVKPSGEERTPNLDSYKRAASPDAVRKLQLMERAKKMVAEHERRTGMPYVSPVSTAAPTASHATTTTKPRSEQHSASLQETDIDGDLDRVNPFNMPTTTTSPPVEANTNGNEPDIAEKKKTKKKTKKRREGETEEDYQNRREARRMKRKRRDGETEEDYRKRRDAKKEKKRLKKQKKQKKQQAAEGTNETVAEVSTEGNKQDETKPAKEVVKEKPKKNKRERPVRKPLVLSASRSRALSAKEKFDQLLEAETNAKPADGVTFMPNSMDTSVQGWQPTKREIARSPSEPEELQDLFEYSHRSLKIIEKRQAELDKRGNRLEFQVRRAMSQGDNESTGLLTKQWFQLIAQKNILLRQTEYIQLRGKEEDLESRFEQVNRKLRQLMTIEDHKKSREQKALEESLLGELDTLLRERDQVAQRLHQKEILAQQEDERVEEAISQTADNSHSSAGADDKACVVM